MNGEADEWQVVVDPASGGVVKQKLQQHLCFIDFSAGGKCLLGSSEMASRIHTGSIWLFQDLSLPIDSDNSLARHYCSSPVMCGAFVNEELVIVAEDTGSVVTYLLNETDKVNFVPSGFLTPHDSWITAMSVCPGGDEVITGGGDSRICVLSDKGTTIKYTYHPAHGAVVSCVAASPSDSSVFASSSMDRSALLWDTRLPKPAKALMEGGCCYTAVAWKDENTVAIGSESGMVHIHDIRTNESSQVIHLQKAAVRKLIFNKNLLASSSDSANVRLWDFKAEEIIFPESNHKNFISDLSWDSKGVLYTCGFDGNVFSCPLT